MYALDEFAADALAVLDALGWEQAALGGTSMGSAVALHLALTQGRRVQALLLAGPAIGGRWPDEVSVADMNGTAEVLEEWGLPAAIDVTRSSLLAEGLPPEATAFLATWSLQDARALAVAIRTVMRWRPFPDLDVLSRLTVPVGVVGWPDDPLHPLRLAEEVARITGGCLHTVEGLAAVLTDPGVVSQGLLEAWHAATERVSP